VLDDRDVEFIVLSIQDRCYTGRRQIISALYSLFCLGGLIRLANPLCILPSSIHRKSSQVLVCVHSGYVGTTYGEHPHLAFLQVPLTSLLQR
jgi:hypothetical protein